MTGVLKPIFDPKIQYARPRPPAVWLAPSSGALTDGRDTAAGTATAFVWTGLLYDALLALSPVGMFPLREASGLTVNDVSTNANDGNYDDVPTYQGVAGPDGFDYARFAGVDDNAGIPDHADYSIAANTGITIIVPIWLPSGGVSSSSRIAVSKRQKDASVGWEWNMGISNDGTASFNDVTDEGSLARRSYAASGMGADLNAWNFLIFRIASTTSYPTIRCNGSNIAKSNIGSNTGLADGISDLVIGGYALDCAMGLVTLVPGVMTDGECATLEATALAEGWYTA